MFNNDAEYARSRIVSSYMRGKGQLYKILDISSKSNLLDKAVITALNQDKLHVQIKITDLEFNIGKLGYVNDVISGIAMFVSRLPLRRDYRQGIRSSQLNFTRNGGSSPVSELWLEQNAKAVNKCINNQFPKLETVIELSEEWNNDIAFSKNFALSSKYKLLYKGFTIGSLNKDDKFKLDNNFNFVEEEFAKEVGYEHLSR
jgi:hypothetical protein